MTTTVLYIAPASGETHHPQARIYRAVFDGFFNTSGIAAHYRNAPERWVEVGLMNYDGKLVYFDGTKGQLEDLKDCEPLMAGLVFVYPGEAEPNKVSFRRMEGARVNLQNIPKHVHQAFVGKAVVKPPEESDEAFVERMTRAFPHLKGEAT